MRQLLSLFVTLLALHQVQGQTFENNGYKDLVVSIHPDVPATNQQQIIDNLQAWIKKGSVKLYDATEKLAYISNVNILLPSTWLDVAADPVSGLAYEDGVIRVDKPNPLYGDGPYTIQPGGCGERGDFMHVTPDFVSFLDTTSTQYFGAPEKLFVHEFAKLRYGVFEEHGYPGDSQFPMFYYENSYVDGQLVSTLTPNFCTDAPLSGSRKDFVDGGSCKFDPQSNLPNGNCIFVPAGDNSKVRSSYMSLPFLQNMDHFCKDTETQFPHNPLRPNKHNAMCDRKSTWTIISESEDLKGVKPLVAEVPPETTFKVLRPGDERFVFVLDVSGSMAQQTPTRISRLQQSSERWLRYEVRNGSQVGVASFSTGANIVHKLSIINTDSDRGEIAGKINGLQAAGGTCLGSGIKTGMNILNGADDKTTGGVILFVTDGKQDCSGAGSDPEPITSPAIIARIKATKVRIITIAFGTSTDPNLEMLAIISGGKVYFVPDGTGIDDINNAFDGSLTFQPALPSGDVDIVVFSEVFKDVTDSLNGKFLIDKTVGRDAKFQMDFIPRDRIEKIVFYSPDGTELVSAVPSSSPFIQKFPFLDVGEYGFSVLPLSGKTIDYLNVVVSAKAADAGEQLPFKTRCWISAGNNEVDMSKTKLAILAQVSQGNRPVFNAKVQAFIEQGSEPRPITLDLLDNGGGADTIANDGIYSRYFIKNDGKNGEYTLRCQVKGDEDTNFVAQKQDVYTNSIQHGRSFPAEVGPTAPACCGSNADNPNLKKEKTGDFERKVTGTSFKLTNVPSADIYPPSRIKDLTAELSIANVKFSFTAPGDDYDEGTATTYDLRYTANLTCFTDDSLWDSLEQIKETDVTSGIESFNPVPSGETVTFEVSLDLFAAEDIYYFAIRAIDELDLKSPTSTPFQLNTDNIPPGTVTDLKTELLPETVQISFTAPGDDNNKGTASLYDVRFSTNEADLTNENEWNNLRAIESQDVVQGSLSPVAGGQTVSCQVKKDIFDPSNYVYIAMKAIDNANLAGATSTPSKMQTDVISPGKATNLRVISTDLFVQISFTAPGDDLDKGKAALYDIRYTDDATDFSNPKLWATLPSITETDVGAGELQPVEAGKTVTLQVKKSLFTNFDVCYFAVKSTDDVGLESEISTIETLVVDIYPPSTVRNLGAEVLEATVNISFTATGDDFDKGTAAYYDMRYSSELEDLSDASIWDDLRNISSSDVISGSFEPVEGGRNVTFEISSERFEEDVTYYLAMMVFDNMNNPSGVSDPVEVTIRSAGFALFVNNVTLLGFLFIALAFKRF